MKCNYCSKPCIRRGVRNGVQQYFCTACRKYQRQDYKRPAISSRQQQILVRLNNESVGIRSIARLLRMAASSVVKYINMISHEIIKPDSATPDGCYEIDEILTYVHKNVPSNYIWITYAINSETRAVVDFVVGKRTKENLKIIVDKVLNLRPKCIYTDGLITYRSLIDKAIHKVQRFKINHIERKNLTLRTHLKRLNRRTICFSRSAEMLRACLMIYFFG